MHHLALALGLVAAAAVTAKPLDSQWTRPDQENRTVSSTQQSQHIHPGPGPHWGHPWGEGWQSRHGHGAWSSASATASSTSASSIHPAATESSTASLKPTSSTEPATSAYTTTPIETVTASTETSTVATYTAPTTSIPAKPTTTTASSSKSPSVSAASSSSAEATSSTSSSSASATTSSSASSSSRTTSSSAVPTTSATTVASTTTSTSSASIPTSGLDYWAKKAGKLYFGTAEDIPGIEQQDPVYMAVLNSSEWGQLTPGNYMKWEFTEPEQGTFDFTGGDVTLDIAEDHGKIVRCHNLVWYNELPDWINNGNWTNATLAAAMQVHIHTLITHWGSRCYAWDVVNEPLNDDGTMSETIFYKNIGPDYVAMAFQYAAAAVAETGADIKLYLNDYNIEFPGAKQQAAVKLIQQIQAWPGARIDGVGLESHFIVGETPSRTSQTQAKESFVALGLDVAPTEIDVRFTALPPTASGLAQQTADYVATVQSCLDVPRCVGITVWDFDDEYSWIPYTFAGQGSADLYTNNSDGSLSKVPAYFGVLEALYNATLT